jgi:hypothetical protein
MYGDRYRKKNKSSKTNISRSMTDYHHHHNNYYQTNKYCGAVTLPKVGLGKKVVRVQMITSRAVRVNDGALDLQTVDRIEVTNRHSLGRGKGTTYSVGGGRGGGPRVHISEGESRSRHFGDMVFFSQGAVVFTMSEVEDAAGVKRLVKAANPHIR